MSDSNFSVTRSIKFAETIRKLGFFVVKTSAYKDEYVVNNNVTVADEELYIVGELKTEDLAPALTIEVFGKKLEIAKPAARQKGTLYGYVKVGTGILNPSILRFRGEENETITKLFGALQAVDDQFRAIRSAEKTKEVTIYDAE